MTASSSPRVVLGVCGGIAAYKAVELCRRLVDAGCFVSPILTKAATEFVGPLTFSALASEPVASSLYDASTPIPHTSLGQRADLIVVAPATADFIARYATGLADDLLTTTLLATRATVLIAPAMHTEMWEHQSVQENLATLRRRGVHVIEPASGRLAGGDVGYGRLAEPAEIATAALSLLDGAASDLGGLDVVITAGGTREAIDPVRFISNRSSGKQGHALAAAALARGAKVTLITTASVPVPPQATVVRVDSAAELAAAVDAVHATADVIVMAAAVADYRPVAPAASKLTKDLGIPTITLEQTPDILAGLVAARSPGQIIVGFAAETTDVAARAQAKLVRKGCDLLVVNDVAAPGVGFDHDTNEVMILGADGQTTSVPLTSKVAVANAVFDRVAALRAAQERTSPST